MHIFNNIVVYAIFMYYWDPQFFYYDRTMIEIENYFYILFYHRNYDRIE